MPFGALYVVLNDKLYSPQRQYKYIQYIRYIQCIPENKNAINKNYTEITKNDKNENNYYWFLPSSTATGAHKYTT